MNAAYRLMGNFPSRGFGDSLSTTDFTSGAAIVSGKDARLPMSGVPRVRYPQIPGEVTEAYHAYEIHPLTFGRLTVMYSATGAMMQANGIASRPCTYTNAVTLTGNDVPPYVSSDDAMCSMLRYNDFVTLQELWVLPKDISILPAKPWVEDASEKLEYALSAPVSDEMLRSLLVHYWRAASLQFFGPWDSGKRMSCLYQDDLLMSHVSNRDRTFTVCISAQDDCRTLVSQAKGFLWQMILKRLPAQIRNITSVAAAVPVQHAQSLYRDAAMCVVYPSEDAKFDFTKGKFPALEADEDRFMQQVLGGSMGTLLGKMHARYAALTGKNQVDECPFMADYDLALALYRVENAADDWALLANWYAVLRHLSQRHDIQSEQAACVMQDVDEFVTSRLRSRENEIARLLTGQTERQRVLMSAKLQSFLWEKSVYAVGSYCEVPARITWICQGSENSVFFTELNAAQVVPEDECALQRMAALMSSILKEHCMDAPLSDQRIAQLAHIAPVYRTAQALYDVHAMYLAAYQNKHPEDRIRLLYLATKYLDADELAAEALCMLAGRQEVPAIEQECKAISSIWPLLKQPDRVQDELNNYIAVLYVRYFDHLDIVSRIAVMLQRDTTDALVKVFSTEPGCKLRLNETNFAYVLGQNAAAECILACAKDLSAVDKAYRNYLAYQLNLSVQNGESLYNWIVALINRSLPTRLYAKQADMESFLRECTELVQDYTLDYALVAKQLPAVDAFDRMLKLAEKKSAVFTQSMDKILDAYEVLLQANAPSAVQQAQQLAPYLTGVRNGTLLQQVTSTYISGMVQAGLQKDSFWQVMNRKDIVANIQRTGALPKQIFDEATRQTAVACIRREISAITQPRQYLDLFSKYASAENEFKRNITLAEFQMDRTISVMWHEVAAGCFMEKFDSFFMACKSIDDARHLMEVGENTVGVRQKINENPTGTGWIIRLLIDVQNFVHNLPDDRQLFTRVVEKAAALRNTRSDKALKLVRSECDEVLAKENNFIRRTGLCLLYSTVFNGYNWMAFLRKLQPEMDAMMHNPYAGGSLPLLAVVSSVLKLFEPHQDLLQHFAHFLRQDVNMAAYTLAVCKDQKAMAQYFPGRENSRSLVAWLDN